MASYVLHVLVLVTICTLSLVYAQDPDFGDTSGTTISSAAPPITTTPPPIDSNGAQNVNAETATDNSTESLWSPGRITHMVLAVLESALLTLVLLFPTLMDPVVSFINRYMGGSGSRRRRDVRDALVSHATNLHDLLLDAIDKFEEMDATLSLYM